MKRNFLFILGAVFIFSSVVFAQTKTVTNADLEKFKQKRLRAEKELRENYREMGFPSPKELKKRNEESSRELSALSSKLRQERLVRETNRSQNGDYRYSGSDVQYSDSDEKADFIDYQQYYGTTYYYPNYNRNRFFRNNRNLRNRRFRRNNRGFQFRGFFGNRNNNRRRTNFGPSRRLTRQNRLKSRRNNIRNFGVGVSLGTRRN